MQKALRAIGAFLLLLVVLALVYVLLVWPNHQGVSGEFVRYVSILGVASTGTYTVYRVLKGKED